MLVINLYCVGAYFKSIITGDRILLRVEADIYYTYVCVVWDGFPLCWHCRCRRYVAGWFIEPAPDSDSLLHPIIYTKSHKYITNKILENKTFIYLCRGWMKVTNLCVKEYLKKTLVFSCASWALVTFQMGYWKQ